MPPRSITTPSRPQTHTRQYSNPPPAAHPPSTSRPGTPSHGHSHSRSHQVRGDIPSRKSTCPASPVLHDPNPTHVQEMADANPGTPTPRQPRRRGAGAKSSRQRNPLPPSAAEVDTGTGGLGLGPSLSVDGKDDEGSGSTSEDELALFDILGVVSPPRTTPSMSSSSERQPGLIVLPQGQNVQLQAEAGKKKMNRRGGRAQGEKTQSRVRGALGPSRKQGGGGGSADERGTVSEGDVSGKPAKNRTGTKAGVTLLDASLQAPETLDPSSRAGVPAAGSAAELQNSSRLEQLLALAATGSPAKPEPGAKTGKGKKSRSTPPAQKVLDGDEVFETKGLSQSLPVKSEGLGQVKKGKGKAARNGEKDKEREKGESDVWDMPDVVGGQELTWQQKLQASSETPTRRAKSSTKINKLQVGTTSSHGTAPAVSSPLVTRPAHTRQVSLDSISLPALQQRPQQQQQPQPIPQQRLSAISAFDGYIPFHTGFNVHRAPQTPAKSIAGLHGNLLPAFGGSAPPGNTPGGGGGELPLIPGEFPRIKGATAVVPYIGFEGKTKPNGSGVAQGAGMGGGAGSGPKYAGPTFHNSPHAATLAKPDMEDF